MPTYQDVTARVRALIGDLPNHYADDNYLLTYVNMAQGHLVSELMASGVREAMFRTSMLVPAGTSRIARWPIFKTLPNELAYSDAFSVAAPPPAGWGVSVGAAPTVSSGISDPVGGTLAKRWSFAADSTRTLVAAGAEAPPALTYYGSVSVWLRTASTDYPLACRVRAGLYDDTGALGETMVAVDVAVVDEWQRVFVPFSGKTITMAPTGPVRRCIEIQLAAASPTSIDLFRAVVRPTHADTGDMATAANPSIAGRIPVLPGGLVTPDKIMERTPGGDGQWTMLRGPIPIKDVPASDRLLQWDWSSGGIDLNPSRADREIVIEYWGSLPDGQLGSNVVEEELPITGSVEPLAAITAGLISQARDQHSAAERFGVMQREGGFSGAAGGLITNLVGTLRKAQQAEPVRRQPYFGFARYPGVSGNVIGAWPWNSN